MHARLGPYRLELATEFGPRIVSLSIEGGPEMLAKLGADVVLEHEHGAYRFHGGHRLWVAPEVPEVSYAPDEHRCEVAIRGESVTITAPPDRTGLVKEMVVSLEGEGLSVVHRVERDSGRGPRIAPWPITQLPLGGTAILPLGGADTSPSANRYLVLWPGTSPTDSRARFDENALIIAAGEGAPIKFGAGPEPGRLGYHRDGFVFIKEIGTAGRGDVPDFGAVGQVYVGQGFCELESVGVMADLAVGESIELVETWRVVECPELEQALGMTLEGLWGT